MATKAPTLRRSTISEDYRGPVRIDKERGIVFGVKLAGRRSRNKREYTDPALRDIARLAEGTKGYIDHNIPGRRLPNVPTRSLNDWACVFKNCQVRADGVYGDAHCRLECEAGRAVMEAAEKFPDKFGLSQHSIVEGYVRESDGWAIVERVVEVKSCDIVDNPATTTSLFEAYQMDENTPAVAAVAPAMSIEDAWVALQNAYMASPDHEDPEKLAILKDIMKLKAKALGTADEEDATADGDTQESVQAPARKSAKARLRKLEVQNMCILEGVTVEDALVESMVVMTDEAVKALLGTLKKGQRPRYGQSPARTGGRKEVAEAVQPEPKKVEIPDDPKALLAWLQQD